MRIGLLTGEYPPLQGGVGAFSHILAQHLSHAGHDVHVFSESRAEQQTTDLPLTTHRGRWNYDAIRAIQQWVKTYDLDLLNMQFQTAAYNMSPWMHFLPHFVHIPFVTTFHDLRFPYLFPKAGPLRDWIVMHLAHQSDGVIVTNYEDYARIEHLPCIDVVPIGSNIIRDDDEEEHDNIAQHRTQTNATQDDFLLAHFGFINRTKGIDTLLLALYTLREQGVPAKLVMIGGRTGTADPTNAHYLGEIDTLIDQLDLSDHIHWTGYVDDKRVSRYLRAADVIVLPYRDGASFRRGSLMAAIQHGCAIVTTTPTHPIPLFSDGSLQLVAVDSAKMLTATLYDLYKNPEELTLLRDKSAQLRHHFDWDHIIQLTITHYLRVLRTSS